MMHSKELVKGTLQTIILKVLSDEDKMYGYEITQKVKALSGEKILLSEGSLYPHLHRMEAEGLLTTETVYIGKRVRKYYSITQTGESFVQQRVEEFADFVRTMETMLDLKPAGI